MISTYAKNIVQINLLRVSRYIILPISQVIKVLNIGYRDRIGWGFFMSDIGGDIGIRAHIGRS